MKRFWIYITYVVLFFCVNHLAQGQCIAPFVTEYTERSTNSLKVKWFDINSNAQRWEIELGKAGFSPTGIPSIDQITSKEYLFQSLEANTAYDFYIRTICSSGLSDWNGPFEFVTNLSNPASCGMNLKLADDNCPGGNSFYMEVSHPGTQLGVDVFLEEIKLLISHDWPPDLKISLESPSGQNIDLISNRGIGTDHFGNPDDPNCEGSLILSQNACRSIQLASPPLRGDYKPEEDLSQFNDGTNPNGIWTFHFCDRANGDIGALLYAELVLNQSECRIPDTLYVYETDQSRATLVWNPNDQCDSLLVSYQISGNNESLQTQVVACAQSQYIIEGLTANTEYELVVQSMCDEFVISSECPRIFTTKCEEISLSETFDNLNRCATICGEPCDINGIWQNIDEDGHDWIVHTGPSPSVFTGPDSDLSQFGNYIYIESSSNSCINGSEAILESSCIRAFSNDSGCDMQFSYLMRGNHINKLELKISADDGMNWSELTSIDGDQGELWKTQAISLSNFQNQLVRFRFIAYGGAGNLADIAIDQIEFFGSQLPEADEIIFYEDKDGDGYGVEDVFFQSCTITPPPGYSKLFGDCDDQNLAVFPNQIEIACNDLDDNCNGIMDDENPLSYEIVLMQNESCLGAHDAIIEIKVDGGQRPYQFSWNNNAKDSILTNIGKGVYFCQIEDRNACIISTDFIEISALEQINFGIESIVLPNCKGNSDGKINIQLSGGVEPYSFIWSNQEESQNLENIGVGYYQLTITDSQNCSFISDSIWVNAKNKLELGIVWQQNPSCSDKTDGQLIVSTIGAIPPLSYIWNTGDTTNVINQLADGLYSVSVTDSRGCLAELNNIAVVSPEELEIQIDVLENLVCFNDATGILEISTFGGTPPYSYQWSTGDFTDDLFNLEAGFYSLTVTDSESCQTIMDSLQISSPEPFILTIQELNKADCRNSNNGSITVEASGGTPPYHYFWDILEGPDDPRVEGLTAGVYQLNAIDQFGCKARLAGIQLESADKALDVEVKIISQNICTGDSIGALEALVLNGNSPFDFNWSAGEKHIKAETLDSLDELIPGYYNVTVTDAEGCVGESNIIELYAPAQIIFQVLNIQEVECFGDSTGFIETLAHGGTGELKYLWNHGAETAYLGNLAAGTYWASISDANNCQLITQNLLISQADKIGFETNSTPSTGGQADGSATVIPFGGHYPYFYEWDEQTGHQMGQTAKNLAPGVYQVTISDAMDCSQDTSVVVDVINAISDLPVSEWFEVYPNPAFDLVTIVLLDTKAGFPKLKLLSPLGHLLKTIPDPFLNKNSIQFSLGPIPSGLYYLQFITADGAYFLFPLAKI